MSIWPLKGGIIADQQSPNSTLWGDSSIKQILLPEGWPSRFVNVKTLVTALRASAKGTYSRWNGGRNDKRNREIRQFGRMWLFHHQIKVFWESLTTGALGVCSYFCRCSMMHWRMIPGYMAVYRLVIAGKVSRILNYTFYALTVSQDSWVATLAPHANRAAAHSAKPTVWLVANVSPRTEPGGHPANIGITQMLDTMETEWRDK